MEDRGRSTRLRRERDAGETWTGERRQRGAGEGEAITRARNGPRRHETCGQVLYCILILNHVMCCLFCSINTINTVAVFRL